MEAIATRCRGAHRGHAALATAALLSLVPLSACAYILPATPAVGDVVYTPPASIDNTGKADVTDALNSWIADDTADGSATDPAVITLTGSYRVEYGITIGSSGQDVAHPDVAAYTRNHVVLDLTNATLLQSDATPYKVNGTVVEPRKRWGVPLVKLVGDTDVTIEGGTLRSTNTNGQYSAQREPWAGVTISAGVNGVHLDGLDIEDVWGDFVYIAGVPWPSNVLIDGGNFARNGRQGITFNNVDGLEVRDVQFTNVERELFDHEPTTTGGATSVYIHDNTGSSGGLGYLNLRATGTSPLHDITVSGNHLATGHFRVLASAGPSTKARTNFHFTDNTTDITTPYSSSNTPLINVAGLWDGVTITNNHDIGTAGSTAVASNPSDTNITTSPNDFVGFGS